MAIETPFWLIFVRLVHGSQLASWGRESSDSATGWVRMGILQPRPFTLGSRYYQVLQLVATFDIASFTSTCDSRPRSNRDHRVASHSAAQNITANPVKMPKCKELLAFSKASLCS